MPEVNRSSLAKLYPGFRTAGMWRNAREVNIHYLAHDGTEPVLLGTYLVKRTQSHVAELASNTYSQSSWSFVLTELRKCEINHKACIQYGRPWCPTRLLRLSMTDEGKLLMRLVSTDSSLDAPRYTTLSHMWGKNVTLQLTSKNLEELKRDIPAHIMPKKYLDAAVATWKLGVRHLWIDSLCIMQDSSADWEHESAAMDRTYRHGYCNIAACSAQLNTDGLFYSREPLLFQAGLTEYNGTYFTYQEANLNMFKDLGQEPLYKRGWVCQERLLCRRNISFTRQQIFFECAMELTCEVGKTAASFKWDSVRGLRYIGNATDLFSVRNMRKIDCVPAWLNVVQVYSAMDLTRPEDKLVAISGLARRLHAKLREPYLAGLWKSHLCIGLAWEVARSRDPEQTRDKPVRCKEFRAPNWSWASIDGEVAFPLNKFSYQVIRLCSFIEEIVGTNSWNEFGQIRYAKLEALGYPFPVRLLERDFPTNEALSMTSFTVDSVPGMEKGITVTLDTAKHLQSARTYALPLMYDRQGCLVCLLLEAITPSWGSYQRIGVLRGSISRRALKHSPADLDYLDLRGHWKTMNAKPRKALCRFLVSIMQRGDDMATLEPTDQYRRRINLI
ncbi:hypothetical protein TruAng_002058 [Truncatella angustata]|nr:hypothetical protein TruAng_002058 [Truncatella angustata]